MDEAARLETLNQFFLLDFTAIVPQTNPQILQNLSCKSAVHHKCLLYSNLGPLI
jgi:hypothetical protein